MARTRIHLITGEVVEGAVADESEVGPEDIEQAKDVLGELASSSKGWQLTVDLPDGGFAIVPGRSVAYVEILA